MIYFLKNPDTGFVKIGTTEGVYMVLCKYIVFNGFKNGGRNVRVSLYRERDGRIHGCVEAVEAYSQRVLMQKPVSLDTLGRIDWSNHLWGGYITVDGFGKSLPDIGNPRDPDNFVDWHIFPEPIQLEIGVIEGGYSDDH